MTKEEIFKTLYDKEKWEVYRKYLEIEKSIYESDELYKYATDIIDMLKSDTSYVRVRAFKLLCKLSKYDKDNIIDKNIDLMLNNLYDDKGTNVRQCLAYLNDLIIYKNNLDETIKTYIDKIDYSKYKDTLSSLIKNDVKDILSRMNIGKILNKIMNVMQSIKYGFVDESGNIRYDEENWKNDFVLMYHLQSPEEILKNKCGVCWDQVELERYLLEKEGLKLDTYFIIAKDGDSSPTHTFGVIKNNEDFYWLEHSWYKYKGIHKYNGLNDLLKEVKNKFKKGLKNSPKNVIIYKYDRPSSNITCDEFVTYCENGVKQSI